MYNKKFSTVGQKDRKNQCSQLFSPSPHRHFYINSNYNDLKIHVWDCSFIKIASYTEY